MMATSLPNRRRISLTVMGISFWSAGGWRARSLVAITVMMAWASMTRVVLRYQESQRRTWCSSRPVAFLLVLKQVSTHQRVPATRTRAGSPTGMGDQQR